MERAAASLAEPGVVWQRPPNTNDAVTMLRKAGERAEKQGKHLLIALDQFEAFLVLGANHDAIAKVRTALQTFVVDPPAGLTLLIVFRSDYGDLVETLGLPPLRQGDTWKDLGPFSQTAAEQFLREGLPQIDQNMLHRLLKGLAEIEGTPGRFRPVTLNMVGVVFERAGGRLEHPPNMLMQRYIAEAITEPEVADTAPPILERMVTQSGSKRPEVQVTSLSLETGLSDAIVRGSLRRLARHSLVRPLDAAQATWEVSHDFLAQLIGQQLGRLRPSFWSRTRRWAAPAAMVLWVTTTSVGIWLWHANEVNVAKARLADAGMAFTEVTAKAVSAKAISIFSDADLIAGKVWLKVLNRHRSLLSLDLSAAVITDLEPLASLTNLKTLELKGTSVKNLAPLTGLAELQVLNLGQTEVKDLTPLADLTNLKTLSLEHTDIKDLTPLAGLTNLKTLDVSFTSVSDLTPLVTLANLQTLNVRGTLVKELAPFTGFTNLRTLDLSYTKLKDWDSLASLTGLQTLKLMGADVADLGPISNLTNLTTLDVGSTQVKDLTPLAELMNLKTLDVDSTQVEDLTPLADLTNLQTLDVTFTLVTDLSPVADVPRVYHAY